MQCDASWQSPPASTGRGITRSGKFSVRIDLAPAAPANSTQAEFLGLCLAVLTRSNRRLPLLAGCDQETAVKGALLLGKGILPSWVLRDGSDLTQRIAIAAMNSRCLRPGIIRQVQRFKVSWADRAAACNADRTDVLHPKTWARRQGMPLTWDDRHWGVIRD